MRFRASSLDEISARLANWIKGCPVCGGAELRRWDRPALLTIGGFMRDRDHPRHDPESNALFLLVIDCMTCGHTMLFNTERVVGPNEAILVSGVTQAEEVEREAVEREATEDR